MSTLIFPATAQAAAAVDSLTNLTDRATADFPKAKGSVAIPAEAFLNNPVDFAFSADSPDPRPFRRFRRHHSMGRSN